MIKNIFDLNNVDDIPENIKSQLCHRQTNYLMIIELFKIKDTLSLDEIMIGMYRKYKIWKSRQHISSCLYTLKNLGRIKKIGKIYKLIN